METNPLGFFVISLGSVHILWVFVWSKEPVPRGGVVVSTPELDRVSSQPTAVNVHETGRTYHLGPPIYDGIAAIMADKPVGHRVYLRPSDTSRILATVEG